MRAFAIVRNQLIVGLLEVTNNFPLPIKLFSYWYEFRVKRQTIALIHGKILRKSWLHPTADEFHDFQNFTVSGSAAMNLNILFILRSSLIWAFNRKLCWQLPPARFTWCSWRNSMKLLKNYSWFEFFFIPSFQETTKFWIKFPNNSFFCVFHLANEIPKIV